MKKNGRTIKEDVGLIRRGLREFGTLLPGQMQMVFWKCILAAGLPYIGVILMAVIVNELTVRQSKSRLLLFVSISIGATFLCYVCKVFLEAKISVGYSRLFSSHELLLTNKAYHMPYEELEKSRVRALRDKVSGTIDLSGGGMASLYWDMEVVFTNLCSAGIAFALCGNFFAQLCNSYSAPMEIAASLLGLTGLVIISSCISCKMTGKRFDVNFEVFEEGAKYKRVGEFYMMDYLSQEAGALDTRIFAQEKLVLEESQKRCYEHFAEGKEKEMRAVNRYDGVKLICTALCGGCVYWTIGRHVLQGSIEIGQVLMQYAAITGLILALSELAQIWTDLRNNNEHLINFFAYMDLPEEKDRVSDVTAGENIVVDSIRFEGVSFAYPDTDRIVLQDVSFEIKGGESLALVGQNGSGKSTLIKLLCGFYKPIEGRILLNDRDVREYPPQEYRKYLSTVFQDFTLFAFTLGENVAAAHKYSKERMEAALKQAGLEEKYKKLPKGLLQCVTNAFEEDGVNLSGGESQKLAIARALYKDAPVMILDEPTAALDPYAEAEIYQQFQQLAEGKTLISVSHRLSSCRMCDRILVLEDGRLIQSGTHAELLQDTQGRYCEMWEKQAGYYVAEPIEK